MSDESDIEKGMAEFYRRVSERPQISTKPFEVRIETQQTPSVPFSQGKEVAQTEDRPDNVLGPPPPGLVSVTPNVVTMTGGTSVTIVGSNFISGSTVKIAGLSATSVVFVDSTHLTCVTPADGLGYVNVEVTNPSGQTVSNATLLRYTDRPDNLLIEGTQEMRDIATGDPSFPPTYVYPYKGTLRLGNIPFVFPTGYVFNVAINTFPFGGANASVVETDPSTFHLGQVTGPVFNFGIQETNIGTCGFDIYGSYDRPGENNFVRLPTYGDTAHQTSFFRVIIDPTGPYPAGVGSGSGNHFGWLDKGKTGGVNAGTWGWVSGDVKTLQILAIKPDGTLDTTYHGTAAITIYKYPTAGIVSASFSATVTFTSGTANLGVNAGYVYDDVSHSQATGYFILTATDGSITGSTPTCGVLNHL